MDNSHAKKYNNPKDQNDTNSPSQGNTGSLSLAPCASHLTSQSAYHSKTSGYLSAGSSRTEDHIAVQRGTWKAAEDSSAQKICQAQKWNTLTTEGCKLHLRASRGTSG